MCLCVKGILICLYGEGRQRKYNKHLYTSCLTKTAPTTVHRRFSQPTDSVLWSDGVLISQSVLLHSWPLHKTSR